MKEQKWFSYWAWPPYIHLPYLITCTKTALLGRAIGVTFQKWWENPHSRSSEDFRSLSQGHCTNGPALFCSQRWCFLKTYNFVLTVCFFHLHVPMPRPWRSSVKWLDLPQRLAPWALQLLVTSPDKAPCGTGSHSLETEIKTKRRAWASAFSIVFKRDACSSSKAPFLSPALKCRIAWRERFWC